MAANCRHNDPATWRSRGTDSRGYSYMVCQECGRFIGYRQPQDKKNAKQKRVIHADDVSAD